MLPSLNCCFHLLDLHSPGDLGREGLSHMLAVQLSDERNLSSPVCFICLIAPSHNFIQDIFINLRNVLFHSLVTSQIVYLFFFPPSFTPQWQDLLLDLLRGPDLFLCTLNVPAPPSPCLPRPPDEDTPLHSIHSIGQYYLLPDALSPKNRCTLALSH